MKLLTRIAGPLCILVDAAILVDIVMDIHHKIKIKRRAKSPADYTPTVTLQLLNR
ncbi:MAG: hypothetical protein J6S97_09640 [Bacteroidales bacterium]|nr:hypothetical protein [Bacteroidales bacterium]